MTPYILPTEALVGLWELVCFIGTLLGTLMVWCFSLR
ncbi:MAG: hypothetical protein KatS3mg111_3409 [Pirellulaceae bacterium]|nr:MAG: hypothetical protein KatS3mg111_3409 [Pirellulaceae bacterium]